MSKSYLNLDVTYQYAIEKLAAKDPQAMAENAGFSYNPETKSFSVSYLGQNYTVSYPDGVVEFSERNGEIPITTKILILHYLTTANGAPMQNKWISFKELPDGAIYIDPFTKRAIRPMISIFGDKQTEFVELAKILGGKTESLGDTSITIRPFPKVPITYVIWGGDDEFPASGNILFDGSAPCYLPTEDYAQLASLIIYQLGGMLQKK